MLWLFGQIWIWLILSFVLGALSAALLSTRIHRTQNESKRNNREKDRATKANSSLEDAATEDTSAISWNEPEKPYDQEHHREDFSHYRSDKQSTVVNSAGINSAGVSPAEMTTVLKVQNLDDQWPPEEAGSGERNQGKDFQKNVGWPGQDEPEWPKAEDWPERNH